jgi:putative sigma-54 modulation protein
MRIDVTFRHMDSTPALREHAEAKIEHLEHYFDRVQDVHVVFYKEKREHVTEITVHSPGEVFKASARTDDMYSSVDSVIHKLERHFANRKDRLKVDSHKTHGDYNG